jgi:hypothetical protein
MGKVDYKALLEDSKRQRAELDAVIAFAERQLGISKSPASSTASVNSVGANIMIEEDTFHGKNILQAAEAYLHMVGRPARSTEEIAANITKGGVPAAAASVATILGRSKGSSVNRVKRGLWGLKEWYSTT